MFDSDRHRLRHGRRHLEPYVRAVFHHQGDGARAPAWAWPPSMASSSSIKAGCVVESQVGEGIDFYHFSALTPANRPTRPRPQATWRRRPCRQGDETILVAEDEPALRELVVNILRIVRLPGFPGRDRAGSAASVGGAQSGDGFIIDRHGDARRHVRPRNWRAACKRKIRT